MSEAAEHQKDEALQRCRAADKTLSSSKGQCVAGALTTSTCAQMADKMKAVREACLPLADSVPPHSRFHFREIIAALEKHQDALASAGNNSKGGPEARRLINDAQGTLKDLTAILNR